MAPSAPTSRTGGGGGGGGGGALAEKLAQTVTSALGITVQLPAPLQPPPQPANVEWLSAADERATAEPAVTVMLQAEGQSMPEGEETTRPAPDPVSWTVMITVAGPPPPAVPPSVEPPPPAVPPSVVPPPPPPVVPPSVVPPPPPAPASEPPPVEPEP